MASGIYTIHIYPVDLLLELTTPDNSVWGCNWDTQWATARALVPNGFISSRLFRRPFWSAPPSDPIRRHRPRRADLWSAPAHHDRESDQIHRHPCHPPDRCTRAVAISRIATAVSFLACGHVHWCSSPFASTLRAHGGPARAVAQGRPLWRFAGRRRGAVVVPPAHPTVPAGSPGMNAPQLPMSLLSTYTGEQALRP